MTVLYTESETSKQIPNKMTNWTLNICANIDLALKSKQDWAQKGKEDTTS